MAMEERIWRKQGLERAAEICEEMAERAEQKASDAADERIPDHLSFGVYDNEAKAFRKAAARIRGEGWGMDRYEWDDPVVKQHFWVERLGDNDADWGDSERSGEGPIKEDLALELLRLAARLKEAEELLRDMEWAGWRVDGSSGCAICKGGSAFLERGGGHLPGCRLHLLLAAGKEGWGVTFEEWLEQKRAWVRENFSSGFDMIVESEAELAEEAWDAAMEEAIARAEGFARECVLLAEERPGGIMATMFRAQASVLRQLAHALTSEATPAPREEAPEAGSGAPGGPAPGPRPGPE
jgi:hypothetical protein